MAVINKRIIGLLLIFLFPILANSAEAWFGVPLPDPSPFAPGKIYAETGFSPLHLTSTSENADTADIQAEELMAYVADQVDISRQSKEQGELIWGRISGREGGRMTTQYVHENFLEIGLEDVHLQSVTMPPQVWPDQASLTLLASSQMGNNTEDYQFRSMMPQPRTPATGSEGVTAELVYAGYGRDVDLAGKDFNGKGAVIRARPVQGGYSSVLGIPDKLAQAGAVFVVVILDIAIDVQMYNPALSGSLVPTFAIADYEGRFIEDVLARADGTSIEAHVMLSHVTENIPTNNVIGKISGTTDEYVIIVAHQDSYFYGAIDNATGIAAMLSLARHVASLPEKPRRTHIFVATGGHHGGGWPGTVQYVDSIMDIREKTAIVLNCEHVAATQFIEYADIDHSVWGTYGGMLLANTEVPKFGTVLPENDTIFRLLDESLTNYGVTMLTRPWDDARGDVYPFKDKGFPVTQIVEVGNWYHTTGDILEAVSAPGMERTTRSFADFLHKIDAMPLDDLQPNR